MTANYNNVSPTAKVRSFFILMLLVGWTIGPTLVPATAQDSDGGGEGGELPIESEWPETMPDVYSRGDKIFGISLGVLFPLFFTGESGTLPNNVQLGGTLCL
jgi:hypothetical protein